MAKQQNGWSGNLVCHLVYRYDINSVKVLNCYLKSTCHESNILGDIMHTNTHAHGHYAAAPAAAVAPENDEEEVLHGTAGIAYRLRYLCDSNTTLDEFRCHKLGS